MSGLEVHILNKRQEMIDLLSKIKASDVAHIALYFYIKSSLSFLDEALELASRNRLRKIAT